LDACDFWPDHDAQAGYVQYEGCCTLNIKKMKNDQHRRGCRKRYGRSRDPDLDVMDQLRAWVREVGLEPFPPTYCVSTSIVRAVGLVGVDTAFFSGTFARTGGLSTAIENGVPERSCGCRADMLTTLLRVVTLSGESRPFYIRIGRPSIFDWDAYSLRRPSSLCYFPFLLGSLASSSLLSLVHAD